MGSKIRILSEWKVAIAERNVRTNPLLENGNTHGRAIRAVGKEN